MTEYVPDTINDQIAEHERLAAEAASQALETLKHPTKYVPPTPELITACAQLGESLTNLAHYHSGEVARLHHRAERDEVFEASVSREAERRLSECVCDSDAVVCYAHLVAEPTSAPTMVLNVEGLEAADLDALDSYVRTLRRYKESRQP